MTKFLQEVRTTNERLRGWSHDSPKQSKMAAATIFNFGKNINNSGLDKDIGTKFHGKMHHGHAEMTT